MAISKVLTEDAKKRFDDTLGQINTLGQSMQFMINVCEQMMNGGDYTVYEWAGIMFKLRAIDAAAVRMAQQKGAGAQTGAQLGQAPSDQEIADKMRVRQGRRPVIEHSTAAPGNPRVVHEEQEPEREPEIPEFLQRPMRDRGDGR